MLRVIALLSVAAMACSSSSSIAYSDLDQALQQARCEQLARCQLFPDQASCTAFFRVAHDVSVAGAITANKIHYDGARAQDCVDATAKLSCDVTAHDTHIAACDEMFVGAVAGGAPCSIDAECASGTCVLPDNCPDAQCCTGMCRAVQPPGQASDGCAKPRDCADGLVCGADHTCRVPGKADDPCLVDNECGAELACIGVEGSTPGMCRALPVAGEPCPFSRCADENLRCDPNTSRCVAVGLPGDPCPMGIECGLNFECDTATALCREFPTLGMPCDGNCRGEAFCSIDATTKVGTCVTPLANNASCDGDQQCQSSVCQDGAVFSSCVDPYVCY